MLLKLCLILCALSLIDCQYWPQGDYQNYHLKLYNSYPYNYRYGHNNYNPFSNFGRSVSQFPLIYGQNRYYYPNYANYDSDFYRRNNDYPSYSGYQPSQFDFGSNQELPFRDTLRNKKIGSSRSLDDPTSSYERNYDTWNVNRRDGLDTRSRSFMFPSGSELPLRNGFDPRSSSSRTLPTVYVTLCAIAVYLAMATQ